MVAKVMALDLEEQGVTTCAVYPGYVSMHFACSSQPLHNHMMRTAQNASLQVQCAQTV
jgi:hypothetical protein